MSFSSLPLAESSWLTLGARALAAAEAAEAEAAAAAAAFFAFLAFLAARRSSSVCSSPCASFFARYEEVVVGRWERER